MTYLLGQVARRRGEHAAARALHRQALELRWRINDGHGTVTSLEAVGGLAAEHGARRAPAAARLLGAADAVRAGRDWWRPPVEQRALDADLERLRPSLGDEALGVALAQGAALTLAQAVAAARECSRSGRPASGPASLTRAERQVAVLAAGGLTNAEIAERLYVGEATAKGHLHRVFVKLGIRSRVELAAIWLDEEEPPGPP